MDRLVLHYNEDDGPAKAGQLRTIRTTHERVRVLACGAAALIGGVVYLNALHNPFVYDDHHTVVQNPSIARVTDVRAVVLGAVTRPIVNFSYALDRAVWGTGPFGFHVTNVLLHMLNVVLLFQLASRFDKDRIVAFAASILLAVHPMMTEAVGYISGRSEVLCATFFMLAMMSGRRWLVGQVLSDPAHRRVQKDPPYVRSSRPWAIATVTLWVAALATKESAAMFPFVFLVYDWLGVAGSAAAKRRRLLTVSNVRELCCCLVVAIGHEDDDVPSFSAGAPPGRVGERVEDGGASPWLDAGDGVGDRDAIGGRAGDGSQGPGERHDEHAIDRPEMTRQPPRGVAQEGDVARHALTAVHQQCVGRGQCLGAHDVRRLLDAILLQPEGACSDAADEPSLPVLHSGLEQHAQHLARLGELERREVDDIAHSPTGRVDGFDRRSPSPRTDCRRPTRTRRRVLRRPHQRGRD